jgi:hypothetical protein
VVSQSHMFKSLINDLAVEMKCMTDNKEKIENTAEKTGEAIGKGVKKSAKAVNDFGKGLKKGIKKEE